MIKEKNFISAVIYVHNAGTYIEKFLTEIMRLLEENFEHSEIICVNDFSTDGSVKQIRTASEKSKSVSLSILNMSYFHGLEIAMSAGVDLSIGDYVLEFDSAVRDYELSEIMRVYREVLKGTDIVSASANKRQKVSSNLFYWLYKKFTVGSIRMQSETFRMLSRRAINRITGMSRTVPYRKGIYANCGLKTENLHYDTIDVHGGEQRDEQIRHYRSNLAINALLLFTDAGYFVSKLMSGIMLFLSLFMLLYTLAVYMMSKPVAGWTTTLLFLAVAFMGLFMILTIIIKYLQILLDLNFKRTKYSFESIEKLTK